MPVSLARSSWMIWSTPGRWSRGFNRMKKRPVFGTTLVLLAPIDDMNDETYGCFNTMAAASRWCAIMLSKEMSWAPSVKAKICPVSSSGMKPFGMTMKSHAVQVQHAVEHPLRGAVQPPVRFLGRLEEAAAEHGRQGQRHHAGDHDS